MRRWVQCMRGKAWLTTGGCRRTCIHARMHHATFVYTQICVRMNKGAVPTFAGPNYVSDPSCTRGSSTYVFINSHSFMYADRHTHARTHARTHAHTHTHTHTHTHAHTRTHTCTRHLHMRTRARAPTHTHTHPHVHVIYICRTECCFDAILLWGQDKRPSDGCADG